MLGYPNPSIPDSLNVFNRVEDEFDTFASCQQNFAYSIQFIAEHSTMASTINNR